MLASCAAEQITYLFLGGVALQIFVALLYKSAMWYLYAGELEEKKKNSWQHKIADKISNIYSIEFFFDIATIVCFGAATYELVKVFIGN